MPVCLKCGYEIVFGPGGCGCTRAVKRDQCIKEAENLLKRLKMTMPKKKSRKKKS